MNEVIKIWKNAEVSVDTKPDMIRKEDLNTIIEAGTYAATEWECSHRSSWQ